MVPKELLPVVDRPALEYVVEEAVEAGLRDVLLVTNAAKPAVEERFAAYDIPATVTVEDYALPYDAKCYAGEGEPLRTTSYVLPKGNYWTLHVTTTGALGWLGNISGLTRKNVFAGFQERGVDVAICPLR